MNEVAEDHVIYPVIVPDEGEFTWAYANIDTRTEITVHRDAEGKLSIIHRERPDKYYS